MGSGGQLHIFLILAANSSGGYEPPVSIGGDTRANVGVVMNRRAPASHHNTGSSQ